MNQQKPPKKNLHPGVERLYHPQAADARTGQVRNAYLNRVELSPEDFPDIWTCCGEVLVTIGFQTDFPPLGLLRCEQCRKTYTIDMAVSDITIQ